jgi:hypothetical protein
MAGVQKRDPARDFSPLQSTSQSLETLLPSPGIPLIP